MDIYGDIPSYMYLVGGFNPRMRIPIDQYLSLKRMASNQQHNKSVKKCSYPDSWVHIVDGYSWYVSIT